MEYEGAYKDGSKNGLWTDWYAKNGQKRGEGAYKDGSKDGLWTYCEKKGKSV